MITKKHFLLAFVLLLGTLYTAHSQVKFGAGLRYNNNKIYNALGITGKVGFGIGSNFDIHANATYYFSKSASWAIDGDLHYKLLNVNEGKFILNPFAGLNFTYTSTTVNSLSLGVFLKYEAEKLDYFVEPRWILNDNQFVLTVGVML